MPTAAVEQATESVTPPLGMPAPRIARSALCLILGLWVAIFFASLFTPPVLDDADGTHANAARQMLLSHDWVTLRVNNVRYLEKAPLPYWIAAASIRIFGLNAFAVHLPQAVAVLLLALLGWRWAGETFRPRAALYTALGVLSSAGVFLFTRVFIPDVLLSLLLAISLYCFLRSLLPSTPAASHWGTREPKPTTPGAPSIAQSHRALNGMKNLYPFAMWFALALAVLTKGLVAVALLGGTAIAYLALMGEARNWRRLRPLTGCLLFLAIAAPWHILAGLRNTGGMNGHGFFWFYFINEHVLRFLGRRIPMDYNKLPGYLYWSLHLVWLFPWSLFVPVAVAAAWHNRRNLRPLARLRTAGRSARTCILLGIYSIIVLVFFSLSTNQEYYTFPAYLPLLMLLAASLTHAEEAASNTGTVAKQPGRDPVFSSLLPVPSARRWLTFAHAAFTALGLTIAAALAYGLWLSRSLPGRPDVGDLLAHRGVGNYTLSMSSLFDLTGPSFAALRLPVALALVTFGCGPAIAWMLRTGKLRTRSPHVAATTCIALASAVFLIAAHLALARFAPMLSSRDFAAQIQRLEATGQISHDSVFMLYGDQAYGSSIPYYLDRPLAHPALLVDGRSSSMLFGSTFPDAQQLFLTPSQLRAQWGSGQRKLLFVPPQHLEEVDRLLGANQVILAETAGKALVTDRPLDTALDSGAAAPLDSAQTKGPAPQH